jgi:hypothetical protein
MSALCGRFRPYRFSLQFALLRARDSLRAVLGDVQNSAVYAECDNAAKRLLLALGGVV